MRGVGDGKTNVRKKSVDSEHPSGKVQSMQAKLPTKSVQEVNHLEAGRAVRQAREKAGMSLRRLAKEMKFSPPFVSDLELGRRNWTPDNFKRAMNIIREAR